MTSDGSRNSQSEDQASLKQTKNVSRLSEALYFEFELKVSTAEMWVSIQEMVLKTAMDVYNKFGSIFFCFLNQIRLTNLQKITPKL